MNVKKRYMSIKSSCTLYLHYMSACISYHRSLRTYTDNLNLVLNCNMNSIQFTSSRINNLFTHIIPGAFT